MNAALLCLALIGANPLQEQGQRVHPVQSSAGMVASQEALAREVGAAMLRQGGNAIDAAVATAYALAVTLPQAGNLGGGGFLVFWNQPQRRGYALNFREMAPKWPVRPDITRIWAISRFFSPPGRPCCRGGFG